MAVRVYIAGPMSGFADHNFPAFDAAAASLARAGFHVISPADISRRAGYTPDADGFTPPEEYARLFRLDVEELLSVEMVVVLRGWRRSRGAKIEVHLAQLLGIPVIDADSWETLGDCVETRVDGEDDQADDRCEACRRWRNDDRGMTDEDGVWVCTPCGTEMLAEALSP